MIFTLGIVAIPIFMVTKICSMVIVMNGIFVIVVNGHIMGVGIAITRGCAAALSFDYSVLLLSMSRNLLTKLKETSLHQYIPTDAHGQFHKVRISCYEQMSFTCKLQIDLYCHIGL